MNDLRKAAEMALEALIWHDETVRTRADSAAITALRAALAPPEPAAPTVVEPVAWIYKPNRELLWPYEVEAANPIEIDEYLPLYATPPRAALSDEQIRNLWFAAKPTEDGRSASWNFARAIEAAHGIGGPRNE